MAKTTSVSVLLALTCTSLLHGTTYYVRSDAPPGGDGLSDATAFRTLNDFPPLNPGDSVRYKRGSSWKGRLNVEGVSGTKGREITFTDYGNPSDPPPFINGNGDAMAVHLKNSSHIIFEKFRVSNFRVHSKTGKALEPNAAGEGSSFTNRQRLGVLLDASMNGEIVNVTFRHNIINHVYGTMNKKSKIRGGGSAMVIRGAGDNRKKGRFNGLYILDNHIHDCVRNGVWGNYSYGRPGKPHYYHQNVVFRRNLIERIPGDGIVVWGCEGALVEENILRNFTPLTYYPGNAAIALWTIMSKDCVFQNNQVTGHRAEHDGQAFDSDFGSQGHIFQYNFSANNIGGVALIIGGIHQLGLLNSGGQNITFRYNLSFNDGFREHSGARTFSNWGYAFHFTGEVKDTWIHNNTFYLPKKPAKVAKELFRFDRWPNGATTDTHVYNNVFFGTEDMGIHAGRSKNLQLNSNVYYRISKPTMETNYIKGIAPPHANDHDLILTDPCRKGTIGAPVKNGKDIELDFFGNKAKPNGLGAYAGESGEHIIMPNRLVERNATLEIRRKLTNVKIEIINLLHKKTFPEEHLATLPANTQYNRNISNLPDGVYYFRIEAKELRERPLLVKFVKVKPFPQSH